MNSKLKSVLIFCCVVFSNNAHTQTLLTDYGSSDTQAFTLAATTATFDQSLNEGTFTGTGTGDLIRGTFSSVNLAAMGTPFSLRLNLTFNTNYSGTIDYLIGSSAGNVIGYTYSAVSLTGLTSIDFLRKPDLDQGTVNLSGINRATLIADTPNFTLNTITAYAAASAVPEPATYAALLGLGGLGFAVYLRRRSVA
jgi:hypothetical protein